MTRAGIDLNSGARFNPVEGLGEGAFQQAVYNLARAEGWRVAHFRPVRVQRRDGSTYNETPIGLDARGWPDLVLVRGSQVLVRELKAEAGRLESDQFAWLEALGAAGLDVGVWRPSDWFAIEEVLRARSPYKTRIELAEAVATSVRALVGGEPVSIQAIHAEVSAWVTRWSARTMTILPARRGSAVRRSVTSPRRGTKNV